MTTLTDLKHTHRATWAAGDYPAVAEHIDAVPPRDLLNRIAIAPGQDVLDVATGTGNVALRAAAAGARVVGLDLTPELFATARRREAEYRVTVEWMEGDAEALPFDDASFDHVLSVFGVQFAPRHEVTAAELARVCRPGGHVGLVNWTPTGLIGELFKIMTATSRRRRRTPPGRRSGATRPTCAACSRAWAWSWPSIAATTRGGSTRPSTGCRSWRPRTARRSRRASA